MGVNGENMAKKWLKETHVHEPIIAAQWPWVAQFVNKYVFFLFSFNVLYQLK